MLRRVIKVLLGLLLGVVVIVVAGFGWLYATESGARFALSRAAAASSDVFSFDTVAGRFSDTLRLTNVRYRDSRQQVTLAELSVSLDLLQLLRGRLVVDNLTTSPVTVRLSGGAAPAPARAAQGKTFDLPLTVQLSRSSIAGITIEREDAEPLGFEQIVLAAAAAGSAARVQRFEFSTQGFFISMQGSVGWEAGFSVDGVVSWSGAVDGSQLLGNAQVTGLWPEFVLEQKTIEPIAQTATGSVVFGPTPGFDLLIDQPDLGGAHLTGSYDPDAGIVRARIDAEALAPGAFVPRWPGLLDMQGDITATRGEPWQFTARDLTLAARLDDALLTVAVSGSLTGTQRLALDRFDVAFGDNRMALTGTVDEALDLTLTAALDDLAAIDEFLARDDIGSLLPALPATGDISGRAAAELRIRGPRDGPDVGGQLSLSGSSYAGLPLAAQLDFASPAASSGSIAIERLEASLGANRVSGSGTVGAGVLARDAATRAAAPLDLGLELALGDFSELAALPVIAADAGALAGRAEASVRLAGSIGRPDVDADVALQDLGYAALVIDSVELSARLGLYPDADTSVSLTAQAPDWSLALAAAGVLGQDQWVGTVSTLSIDEPWLGNWQIETPVPVALAPSVIEISNACLVHADSGVCVDWHTGDSVERIRVRAQDFELGVLAPVLPPSMLVSGRLSLDAELNSPRTAPSGMLTASGNAIGIDIAVSDTDNVETFLESIALEATLADYALEARADIVSLAGGQASIELATADVRATDAAISGHLDVSWPDLASLSLLSPDVGEVGGTVTMAIDVAGTAANPDVSGSAMLTGGHVAVPEWGILIDRIEAEATSSTGSSLEYVGSGYIEDSEVRLTGATEIDLQAGWPTRLRVTGDYVPVVQRPDVTVYASPTLDAVINLPRIEVVGRVVIPEAEIGIDTVPVQAVKVSPDSVLHGQVEDEPLRPITLNADVSVELGDSVHYRGSNLDAMLDGELRLLYESGLPPTASGGLQLNGGYDAYGQRLELERGELLFAGPLDDPALDVLAVREVGTTRVGVRLSGTLRSPVTSMYSDPPMSELNALSYLRFGRPIQSTDGADTVTLESTALALGLQQALPAVQRVGDALQLDEFAIEPTEVDAGSLMAGKYLSPKVYLSYTYGLFNRLGGFLLRYQINDRFSIETRSGNEKAMDFLYSVEKEK